MAWNPSPEVAAARDVARQLDADQVVVITFNYARNQMGVVTYGKTKQLCAEAKQIGEAAYAAAREKFMEVA